MRLLYFAWLRERIGLAEEDISPPLEVTTVSALLDWLKSRGPGYAAAFADLRVIRVAINQEYATSADKITPEDEIAIFPPVTGG